MTLNSTYQELGPVGLPLWKGRRHYMHTFDISRVAMPEGLEDYTEPVEVLCRMAGRTAGTAHVTIDEKIVTPGRSQRRPGPHVDGRFMGGVWRHTPSWVHGCAPRMAVIVASDVPGCIVYPGLFEAEPKPDGDLSHIKDRLGDGRLLPGSTGFLLGPDCVHESMTFRETARRVFVRIALED